MIVVGGGSVEETPTTAGWANGIGKVACRMVMLGQLSIAVADVELDPCDLSRFRSCPAELELVHRQAARDALQRAAGQRVAVV